LVCAQILILALVAAVLIFVPRYEIQFANYIYYAAVIIIVITVLWFIYKLFERRSNLWAVTNFRVIDEYGVFTNNSKETPLEKINNISFRQSLMGRVFNYGDVQIQSAAEAGATLHEMVSRPNALKDAITQCQEEYRQDQIKNQARSVMEVANDVPAATISISEEISKLYELKVKGIITEAEYQKLKEKIMNS
jgi:membrane protein YdbS with pleckstrin-like domain